MCTDLLLLLVQHRLAPLLLQRLLLHSSFKPLGFNLPHGIVQQTLSQACQHLNFCTRKASKLST
jgi:hypothetical protein